MHKHLKPKQMKEENERMMINRNSPFPSFSYWAVLNILYFPKSKVLGEIYNSKDYMIFTLSILFPITQISLYNCKK